jgi:hypothetical protein
MKKWEVSRSVFVDDSNERLKWWTDILEREKACIERNHPIEGYQGFIDWIEMGDEED